RRRGGDELDRLGALNAHRRERLLHAGRAFGGRGGELLVVQSHPDRPQGPDPLRSQQQVRHLEDRRERLQTLLPGEHRGQCGGAGPVDGRGQPRGCRGRGLHGAEPQRRRGERAQQAAQRLRRSRLGALQAHQHGGGLLRGEEHPAGGRGEGPLHGGRVGELGGRRQAGRCVRIRDEDAVPVDLHVRGRGPLERGGGEDRRGARAQVGVEGRQVGGGDVRPGPQDVGLLAGERGERRVVGQRGRGGGGRGGGRLGGGGGGWEVRGLHERGEVGRGEQAVLGAVRLRRRVGIGESQRDDLVGQALE